MKNLFTMLLMLVVLAGYSQKVTNTWNGSYNFYWHNANNWSLGHIPTSTEDVVIPNGMLRYPSVDIYNEEIKSLTIQSNAEVRIYDKILDISGAVNVYGELRLLDSDANLTCDDITWYSGSQAETAGNCLFKVNGIWEFSVGADVQLENGRVWFVGISNQYIRSRDADCYFHNVYVQKTAGVFGLSGLSSATCKIKKNLIFGGSNYTFTSPSSQKIEIGYALQNGNSSIDIALDNGTIEFTADQNINSIFLPNSGDYINNLIVNTGNHKLELSTFYQDAVEVRGDLTINSGTLNVIDMELTVGGDWSNNVGPDGFEENTARVIFNGSSHQYCSDEAFYTLEVDKSGGALRINGTDVECLAYEWTSGAVDVLSGSFTANDLLDNAIQGSFYLNSGGVINLHNDDGYIDLKGDLYIYGGEFNVYGGTIASYWPYGEDASITMEDGTLDFKDQGIKIYNTAYALNDNITGGRIKCAGYLHLERADFTPNAGIFEMYGPTSVAVKTINGARFWDLAIDKVDGGKESSVKPFTDRDGTYYDGSKGNSANAVSNIACYSHLYIDGGTFDLGTYDFSTTGSAVIYGTLEMNSASNDFSVGWDIHWLAGSSADVTAGNFYVGRDWYFENGTSAQLGTGNTVHLVNNGTQRIYNNDADAEFGSVSIENTDLAVWLYYASDYPMKVAGNMTVLDEGYFVVQDQDLTIDGTLDIQNGGYLRTDGPGDLLTLNSNFTLNGELEVGDGDAFVHGTFDIASTGELTIAGGSFTYDEGVASCGIYGTFNMTSGTFTANEGVQVMSGSNVNIGGGTITSMALIAEYINTFQPSGGTFECQSNNGTYGWLKMHSSNYFHDLKINPVAGAGGVAKSELQINNDLIVTSGSLYLQSHTVVVGNDATIHGGLLIDGPDDILIVEGNMVWKSGSYSSSVTDGEIQVAGNWTFENGTNAQLGENNVVKFIGGENANIYNYDADAEFGHIWAYKTSGATVYMNGLSTYPVACSGGLSVENACHFDVQHEGLETEGNIYVGNNALLDMLSLGSIHCGGDLDIWGTLVVDGGEMTVEGDFALQSLGTLSITDGTLICNRPAANINFPMKGNFNLTGDGLFEISNNNIEFFSTANTNMADGTVRVGGHFFATHPGTFEPTGGKVEMSNGYVGGQIFCNDGNYFYDLEITDEILVGDDLTVNHDLDITSGLLNINPHTVEVGHDVNIHGTLVMTNSLGVLECGNRIYWHPGSNDNITAGNIYTSNWNFEDGTNAMLGTGNTTHISGGFNTYDEDAEFGNLICGSFSKSESTKSKAYGPTRVAGFCTFQNGASWFTIDDWYIQGTFDIEDGSSLSLSTDNTINTYSDFTLNGRLDLNTQGNGYVDGEFHISSSGELIIDGGEFIIENSSVSYNHIYGTLTMTDGLFWIDRNIKFESTANANISGGMIRSGGFYAQQAGAFEPTGGTVEIHSSAGGQGGVDCSDGNYLYNFSVNALSLPGGAHLNNNLLITNNFEAITGVFNVDGFTATVQGNVTFYNGGLWMTEPSDIFNAGDDPTDEIRWTADATFEWNNTGLVNIFGNCTVENGVAYNVKTDQTFAFVGTGDQEFNNMDDATFGTIELDKPSGGLIIPSSSAVNCSMYNENYGTLTVNGGSFIAQDLAALGIFGEVNLNGGLIDITQNVGQKIYLRGSITITDGIFNLRGGQAQTLWGHSTDFYLTMSGGTFDCIDNGIWILPGLNMNVTGGKIRTNENFENTNTNFAADGGEVEIYGPDQVDIICSDGYFHDLRINGGVNNSLSSDILIMGDLLVDQSYLITHGREITCMGNIEINSGGTLEIWDGSTIKLNNQSHFTVNENGHFNTYGEPGDKNLITQVSSGDYYYFDVENHGFINPRQTIFEYMTLDGVNLHEYANLGVQRFNDCIFRLGKENGALLTLNNDESFTIDGAEFYSSSKGSNYNVYKNIDDGHVTFTNFTGNFAGPAYEKDPYNRVDWFEPELAVTPSNRNVGAAAGTTTFSVTSNIDWTVTEGFDWIDVSPMGGTGDGILTVNYDENTSIVSRMASITISGDDVPNVIVTVTQSGADPVLVVTPDNQNVGSAPGMTTFNVQSNVSWTVNETLNWLSVDPMSGSGSEVLTVNFDENTSVITRTGTIKVSSPDAPPVLVTVTQAGADPELTLNPGNQNVGAASGSTSFDISSNISWLVSENVLWLGVNPITGNGDGTITVIFDENTSIDERVGEITVSANGVPDVVVTVTQAGANPVLEINPLTQTVPAASGTTTVEVISNIDWTVSESVGWLSVSPMSGSGNASLTINYDENPDILARLGPVTVSADGVPDMIATISQLGANPLLEINPLTQTVSAAAGTTTVEVISNMDWTVSESVGWLSVSPMSGSGNVSLTINYDENPDILARLGPVTVSADGVPDMIATISQLGANPVLEINPLTQTVSAAAGTTTVEVISNMDWTVSESVGWLSVSPMSGSGNASLTINYDENPDILARLGPVTVSADGVPDMIATISQSGANPVLTISPVNQNVGFAAGTTTFDIESNTSWDASETLDWLSVNPANGTGDDVLEVSYLENNTGSTRVGEITISTTGKLAVVVTVTQDGDIPELSVDPDAFDFLAPNGINFLNVYSNTTWIITDNMDWLGLNLDTPAGNQVVQVSVMMNNTGVVRSGEIVVETEDGSIEIIIPVTQQPFVEHIISLPAGWSGMSSYALPLPPFVEDVFSGIEDDLIIAIGETGMYYPAENVNTIGMWEQFSAYKIKTDAAVYLSIYGSAYPSKTMTIPAGWSMLPVISECDVDLEMLFDAMVDNVVMVKDIAGYGIYWPEMGINTIGVLQPGMAYYILTEGEIEITFPECDKASNLNGPKEFGYSNPAWPEPQKTPASHSIFIHPDAIDGIEPGSVLGAFDLLGYCYGITVISETTNYIQLFGDDQTTTEKDGFTEGEQISFRLYNPATNEQNEIEFTWDYNLANADGTFANNGMSVFRNLKQTGIGTEITSADLTQIYPNPSSGTIFIEDFLPGSTISIMDMHGQLVFEKAMPDSNVQQINLDQFGPGTYTVIIKNDLNYASHKLILK